VGRGSDGLTALVMRTILKLTSDKSERLSENVLTVNRSCRDQRLRIIGSDQTGSEQREPTDSPTHLIDEAADPRSHHHMLE
jgi:hypothetical protein